MKKLILPVVLIATMMGTATSCKKKNTETTKDKLVGTWKETSYMSDDNNNGKMDDVAVTTGLDDVATFKSDGTGTDLSSGNSTAFNWGLSSDNSYIILTAVFGSVSEHIDQLSGSTLVMKDTTAGYISWATYTKQ
jgi:hypothetical protein